MQRQFEIKLANSIFKCNWIENRYFLIKPILEKPIAKGHIVLQDIEKDMH